jgi:decaprenylphospho-beta-D-erythro-pentofuranosid-2-ulose 2-reductase
LDGFFLGLGEALRAHGVRVLVVRPGFVKSKMTAGLDEIPLSVTPDDVAEAITAAIQSKRELIWVPGPLRAVMSGLRHVPRPLFRRLPL